MMIVPEVVASTVQPWADLYASSVMVSSAVQFLHLSGLLVAGGFALAFDRSALRASTGPLAERTSFVRELRAVHRPVMFAMLLVVASGAALLLSDVEALLPSTIFWLKMVAFVLLVLNGLSIRRTGAQLSANANDVRGWRALRSGSIRSIALWIFTVFLGVLLTAAA